MCRTHNTIYKKKKTQFPNFRLKKVLPYITVLNMGKLYKTLHYVHNPIVNISKL